MTEVNNYCHVQRTRDQCGEMCYSYVAYIQKQDGTFYAEDLQPSVS
jgi:hypothetical protein